jgi:hypothetical protein
LETINDKILLDLINTSVVDSTIVRLRRRGSSGPSGHRLGWRDRCRPSVHRSDVVRRRYGNHYAIGTDH